MTSKQYAFGALAACLLMAGCGRQDPAVFVRKAVIAEAQAKAAFEKHDVEGADLAAARAEEAVRKLKLLVESSNLSGPAREQFLQPGATAALGAANFAQLAHEELQRREVLATLKLKVYQKLRGVVCDYGLAGPALAAEQLARAGTNSPSATQQALAAFAGRLVGFVDSRPALSNGLPDWAGIAADLRAWSNNPPPAVSMFLALSFGLSGWTDFALCESEAVDPSKLTSTNSRSIYHLQRCGLFAIHGWDRSAARELDHAIALSPEGWQGLGRTQALVLFHFWLAEKSLARGHQQQANHELVLATQAWPESPLAALLRAEQLAANADWARAADLLQAESALCKNAWLASCMSRRATELRDRKAAAPALFTEPGFLLEVVVHCLGDSAEHSAAAQKLQEIIADAKTFGLGLADKLPAIGK